MALVGVALLPARLRLELVHRGVLCRRRAGDLCSALAPPLAPARSRNAVATTAFVGPAPAGLLLLVLLAAVVVLPLPHSFVVSTASSPSSISSWWPWLAARFVTWLERGLTFDHSTPASRRLAGSAAMRTNPSSWEDRTMQDDEYSRQHDSRDQSPGAAEEACRARDAPKDFPCEENLRRRTFRRRSASARTRRPAFPPS